MPELIFAGSMTSRCSQYQTLTQKAAVHNSLTKEAIAMKRKGCVTSIIMFRGLSGSSVDSQADFWLFGSILGCLETTAAIPFLKPIM
jgi:hypothetical protein